MVCQLSPFGVNLGLNNSPRIGFTLVKSRLKKIRRWEQGDSRCKTAGAGYHLFPNSALKCVPKTLANRGRNAAEHGNPRYVYRGLPPRKLTHRGFIRPVYTIFRILRTCTGIPLKSTWRFFWPKFTLLFEKCISKFVRPVNARIGHGFFINTETEFGIEKCY
jgi:hypothetical protein